MPPPSTLQGLLAAALGLTIYEEALSGLYLSARPLGSQRSLFQTVNYLFLKEGRREELRGLKGGRSQIPLQFLVGEEGNPLAYEVYVAAQEEERIEDLARALQAPAYPLALGPAFALAWAEEVEVRDGEARRGWEGEGIGWWRVGELDLKDLPPGTQVYRDLFPVALGAGRVPKRVEELALEVRGVPFPVVYKGEVLRVEGLKGQALGVVKV